MIDLHMHTTYSDGTESCTTVLKKCQEKNLNYISITDHNTALAYKELETLDEANGDIVDLCINPKKGYDLLKNSSFNFKGVLIQPGAESKEIKELLEEKGIPYLEGCALVGLRLYK